MCEGSKSGSPSRNALKSVEASTACGCSRSTATSSAMRSGCITSSASIQAMNSPRASRMPALRAEATPPLALRIAFTPGSRETRSHVRSLDPSSTTMTSQSR